MLQTSIDQFLKSAFALSLGLFPERFVVEAGLGCRLELTGVAHDVGIHDVVVVEAEENSARHSQLPFALLIISTTVSIRRLLSVSLTKRSKSGFSSGWCG